MNWLIIGELALDGLVRSVRGVLSMVLMAKKKGISKIIVPKLNEREASIVEGLEIYGVSSLNEVVDLIKNPSSKKPVQYTQNTTQNEISSSIDFEDVKGHNSVKRALEISASGGHNLLMIGSPGSGKSMLAKRFSTILPPLSINEALETTKIHSIAGYLEENRTLIAHRPFRSPHHTSSDVALVGGGSFPQPGEISLAHNGVLFLDELPEFKKSVLETLRQPLEDRKITISRSKYKVIFPASFMLIAAMNPSPSGYFVGTKGVPQSSMAETKRYLAKISGPLLDRIDIHIEVNPISIEKLTDTKVQPAENSATIRERVTKARAIQLERFKKDTIFYNAQMNTKQLKKHCVLNENCIELLKNAVDKFNLSTRAYDRILKLSRTLADMEGVHSISASHIAEAIQYRTLDRGNIF